MRPCQDQILIENMCFSWWHYIFCPCFEQDGCKVDEKEDFSTLLIGWFIILEHRQQLNTWVWFQIRVLNSICNSKHKLLSCAPVNPCDWYLIATEKDTLYPIQLRCYGCLKIFKAKEIFAMFRFRSLRKMRNDIEGEPKVLNILRNVGNDLFEPPHLTCLHNCTCLQG